MLENRTILLVDADPLTRRILRTTLISEGAKVIDVHTGAEALDVLRAHAVDLVLLDLNMPGTNMPGTDGLDTCRAIRGGWVIPIIMISARNSDRDKIEALDAGADDFVSKPFSLDELMARIRAALRRTGFATDTSPKRISLPNLEIDFESRRVIANNKHVRLTPTEFNILRYLISQANKPVPHKRVLQAIWGPECGEQLEYLRVFINQLRNKIEPPGSKPTYIVTEPRIGYRFVLPNSSASETPPAKTEELPVAGRAVTTR